MPVFVGCGAHVGIAICTEQRLTERSGVVCLPKTPQDDKLLALAPAWHVTSPGVYTTSQKNAGVYGPLYVYAPSNWVMLVRFLCYRHAHINWLNMRMLWDSMLSEGILYILVSYSQGNGRTWLARRGIRTSLNFFGTPNENNGCASIALGISAHY